MAILAIDTSTIVSGAAIVQKDKLVAEIIMQLKLPQSEVLLGHVQDVLKIAHMDKSDLTGVAISIGRIGLATAKMLSYALSIPVVAVSSLEAMAYQIPCHSTHTKQNRHCFFVHLIHLPHIHLALDNDKP